MNIKSEVAALKRESIVAAAADLFYKRGYENTNLDSVGQALGVTKPFIYFYFKSKSSLLGEICSRGISSSLTALNQSLAGPGRPTEKLQRFSIAFTTAVLTNQKFIAVFSREEKNLMVEDLERINDMRRVFDRKLREFLELGAAAGEFSFPDSQMTALAIGGAISWAWVWYRPYGRLSVSEVADDISQLVLNMVGAATTAAQLGDAASPARAQP